SRSKERLQGVISFQLEATAIWGLDQSSSPIPTARSMPRAAVAPSPSVTSRLRGLMSAVLDTSSASVMCRRVRRSAAPRTTEAAQSCTPACKSAPPRRTSERGGANYHHVGQVGDGATPCLTRVGGDPHRAVACSLERSWHVVVVRAHRVSHHTDVEPLR